MNGTTTSRRQKHDACTLLLLVVHCLLSPTSSFSPKPIFGGRERNTLMSTKTMLAKHANPTQHKRTSSKQVLFLYQSSSSTSTATRTRAGEDTITNDLLKCDKGTINTEDDITTSTTTWSSRYMEFAKTRPFANNIIISTTKTTTADLLAQTLFAPAHHPPLELDLLRSLLFAFYGALYLGAFQYFYQVGIFNQVFDVQEFTQLPWTKKIRDIEGLQSLAAQVILDMTVVAMIALPVFYIFKASVLGGGSSTMELTESTNCHAPMMDLLQFWTQAGLENYHANFVADEATILKVWVPANLVIFSVPLYLRLPLRHVVSFVWTTYFSLIRGGT
mmetsp:Transcript_20283/g.43868  ORF Transcript_20283/g.43868 Transcript_20283/m.43868 type:complete len:332 (-) Transcript_20283:193-1188(-)